jgi:hypothetical protein
MNSENILVNESSHPQMSRIGISTEIERVLYRSIDG